jgi:short-subunit dehydrogenase
LNYASDSLRSCKATWRRSKEHGRHGSRTERPYRHCLRGKQGVGARLRGSAGRREGVDLILNARNAEQLEQSASENSSAHEVSVKAVAGDIASAAGREAVLTACPFPDILVNNAGGPPPGKLKTWTADDWSRALEGNLRAPAAMLFCSARR